jgi:hypothetical protein
VIERFTQSTLPSLWLLDEDAHLETNRRFEGEPSRSGWSAAKPSGTSDDSASDPEQIEKK